MEIIIWLSIVAVILTADKLKGTNKKHTKDV